MLKKVTNYLTIGIFLTSFHILSPIAEENVDCSNIKKSYERARLFLDAKNNYSNEENGVGILQSIVQKCKKETPNRDNEAFARTVYALGNAYWRGRGITKDRHKGCEYYHEVLKNSQSLPNKDKNNIENDARLHIGDGAYWGFCEEKNWTKALPYYFEILANSEKTDANILAWTKGRIADAYREGDGVEQNHVKSLALFQEIENDNKNITDKSIVAWAKYWKAHAYQHGRGVEQNTQQALAIFTDIVNTYKSQDPIAVEYAQKQIDEIRSK